MQCAKERDKGKQSSTQEEVEYTKGVIRNRKSKGRHSFSLFVCLVVFDATFKYLLKTTDLSQVTDKLYHIMLCNSL